MDPARWQHIQDLFDAALERPANARADFLADACGDDTALYDEVRSLLAADTQGHSLLDGLAMDALDLADEEFPFALTEHPGLRYASGDQVGPYCLLEPLASGGMGTVFLAERADGQFEQRVALKLVRSGLASEVVLARFQQERQILARLHHPHIARLLDGGLTEHGHPYFAMEYVEGTPLTAYCDARQLSVPDRLALFLDIGRAVQVAHRNLVVHRDLKPSNILVTEDGQVKLLDFGIAKVLTDTDADLETPLTRTGMRVMTPEYAAPEQIRGEPVTTATDVYALGVILYELLTGRRPHESAHRWEVEQAVLQTEPLRPSTAVRQWASSGDTQMDESRLGETRNATVDHLVRRLRGDLDTICQKALQKQPDERYASVEQFMEDVRRHLDGLPIIARRPTAEYRLRKFVQRHRTGVLATTAGIVLLILLVTFYTVRLAQERDRARQEAEKATQIAGFLTGLFQASDPSEARGETLSARDLLVNGSERIEAELANQPDVQAQMMVVIGNVYRQLGLYSDARPLLEHALQQRRTLFGERNSDVVVSMSDLAHLLTDMGEVDEAVRLFRQALDLSRDLFDPNHPDVISSISNLGYALHAQGTFEEADSLLRLSLALTREHIADEQPLDLATELNNYGMLLYDMGRLNEARPLLEEALAIRRDHLEAPDPLLALSIDNVAGLLVDLGEYDAGEVLYEEALAMRHRLYDEAHPDLAYTYNNLGLLHQEQGKLDQAEAGLRMALSQFRQIHGEEHADMATTLNNLGIVLKAQGRLAEAEASYREALRMKIDLLSEDSVDTIISKNSLALLLMDQGHLEEAHRLLQQVYDGLRQLFGDEHPYLGITLNNLGTVARRQGRLDEAEAYTHDALAMQHRLYGDEHIQIATTLYNLGQILHEKDAIPEALVELEASVAMFRATAPAGSLELARALFTLGTWYAELSRPEAAEPLLREALTQRQATLPALHPDLSATAYALADLLIEQQRYADAEPLLLARFEAHQEAGTNTEAAHESTRRLVDLYEAWGKPDQAALYRSALATSGE